MPDPLPENVLVEEETKIVQALYEPQQWTQDGASVVAGLLSFSGVLVAMLGPWQPVLTAISRRILTCATSCQGGRTSSV